MVVLNFPTEALQEVCASMGYYTTPPRTSVLQQISNLKRGTRNNSFTGRNRA